MTTSTEAAQPANDGGRARSRQVAGAVSVASDFGALWVALSALQVLTGRSSLRAVLGRLGAAGITSLVLTRLLKHQFAAPRPELIEPTIARTPTSSGFPSGHTLAAFASALVLPRTRVGRALALAVASLVAWSRVEVGHHRPVDVVVGAAVGSTAGAALAVALA